MTGHQRSHAQPHDAADEHEPDQPVGKPGDADHHRRRTDRHDLLRMHTPVGLLAKALGDLLPDQGHPGLAADEDDFVDVFCLQAGVGEGHFAWPARSFDEVVHESLELDLGDIHIEMNRALVGDRDERDGDESTGRK